VAGESPSSASWVPLSRAGLQIQSDKRCHHGILLDRDYVGCSGSCHAGPQKLSFQSASPAVWALIADFLLDKSKLAALYVAHELKCAPLVVEAMKKFPQDSFLQKRACGIMKRLACHGELKVLLVEADVRTQLAMALDNHKHGTGEYVEHIKHFAAAAMKKLLP